MRQRGFTLVEVLVALAIFALMAVFAYRGLGAVLQTREHLAEDNRRWRDLALALRQLELDLDMAVDRPVRDAADLVQPALVGDPGAFGEQGALLSVSRMGDAWYRGVAADVQRHGYRLNQGRIEQLTWPALDQAPHTEPDVQVLLERVGRFELRYLDDAGQWQPRWPLPGGRTGLPAALEAVVELQEGVTVTRVFALP
jgi:general secretion pathway protein J